MADVHLDRVGAVLVVEIAREEHRNAISGTMLAELADAFDEARRDDAIRAVVTTARGQTFCVGGDLPEMLAGLDLPTHRFLNGPEVGGDRGYGVLSDDQARLEQLGVGRWALRMLALEKPTVAALNGSAAGGGLGIALLHDYRIAAAEARLSTSWTRVGVAPEMGASHLLPRLVGHRVAFDLLLRSPVLTAAEALEIGLVDRVEPADAVRDAALELATELAALPTLAVQMTKRLTRSSGVLPLEQQLKEEYRALFTLFDSPDVRASMKAHLAGVRQDGDAPRPAPSDQ